MKHLSYWEERLALTELAPLDTRHVLTVATLLGEPLEESPPFLLEPAVA